MLKTALSIAALLILSGCSGNPTPDAPLPIPSPTGGADPDPVRHELAHAHEHPDPALLKSAPGWQEPLLPAFEYAAAAHDVPLDLLIALGWIGSAFENRGDVPTIEGGYGVMALRENQLTGDSLGRAAMLTGATRDDLIRDPRLSITGAAAVLDADAREAGIRREDGIEAWLPAIVRYAGLDEEDSRFFARGVYERLQLGLDVRNSHGERFQIEPRPLHEIQLDELIPPGVRRFAPGELKRLPFAQSVEAAAKPDYAAAIWDPTTCFTSTVTSKDTVVVHTIEGSAAGARSWMKNCANEVSSHYVVSEAGGVWQLVEERYRAWHAGCYNGRSVGIEHEGYAGSSTHPQALYDASAALVADICNRNGIPKQKTLVGPGIIGHIDVTNCCCGTHWDPGPGWDWNYYIARVNNIDPVKFTNAVANGGFENDLDSWVKPSATTADILTTAPHGGAKYCRVHRAGAYATIYQDAREISGNVWRTTCWAYAAAGMTDARFGFKDQSGVDEASAPVAIGPWQFYSVDWTVSDNVDVQVWGTGDSGVFIDDVRAGKASRMNWITDWLRNGTYAASLQTDHLAASGGEANVYPLPAAEHGGRTWTPVSRPDGFIDLDAALGGAGNCVTYAHVYVVANGPKSNVNLVVGADDGLKVFLNGAAVHTNDADSSHDYFNPDEDVVQGLSLNAGENRLMIKVREASGAYSFSARFCDDNGDAIPGLTYRLAPGAVVVGHTLPSTMQADASQSVSITVRNTGDAAWTKTGGYKLGAVGDSDPFAATRHELSAGESIVPGGTRTFTFSMTAPPTAGYHVTDWRMVQEGVQWMGQPLVHTINVVPGIPGDMDHDNDVDQEDFGAFQACMSGFLDQTVPACAGAKLDADDDVDAADFDIFNRCMTGANVSGSITCAD